MFHVEHWRALAHGCSGFADVDGGDVRLEATHPGAQALSAGADAGAAVPLQPGVRRLRQDPVSRARAEAKSLARRVLPRGRRVWRADGVHPRRRAADASPDRRDRRGPGRAQEVHLSLHQRAVAQREDRSVQAQQVPDVLGARRRRARASRLLGLSRRRIRSRARRHERSAAPRLSRDHEHHALRRRRPQQRARFLRPDDGAGRRGHDALARLLV